MNNQPELKRIYVKPAQGRIVINTETNRRIPVDGELVIDNAYMRRRIKAGDVTISSPPAEKKPAAKKEA